MTDGNGLQLETNQTLIGTIIATLRSYWKQAYGYQKFLYFMGALLLISGLFHTAVLIVTDGSMAGSVSWRKPITFGFSMGVTCNGISKKYIKY